MEIWKNIKKPFVNWEILEIFFKLFERKYWKLKKKYFKNFRNRLIFEKYQNFSNFIQIIGKTFPLKLKEVFEILKKYFLN